MRDAAGGWPLPPALLAFALLSGVTVWMWRSAAMEAQRGTRERFGFKVTEAEYSIQQRLLAYEQILRGGVALYAASMQVSRAEWRDYVRTLEIHKDFPGIQGIAYAQRVSAAQLPAHTRALRAEGFADYAIRPAGARAEYTPIVFIEPFDWRNQRALGYDMGGEPVLRAALERARDTGMPSVSGKVILAQEIDDGVQSGFHMCLPVLRNGSKPATPGEREAALSGYVCASFRMNELMQGILGQDQLPNIQLRIFDGAAAAASGLMYDSMDGANAALRAASFTAERLFDFNGRKWTLRFDSTPAFDAGVEVQKPRLILASGLLISALFGAMLWSLGLNRRRARALAGANAGLQGEIAERAKLELALNRAKDAAEAANLAKSDFLANVSHELRTPLTLILAPLEQLLGAGGGPADGRAQLERAQRNALLLLSRVNDILDYSKVEAGKFELHWESVDLDGVLGVLAGDAAIAAAAKGCALTWRAGPGLEALRLDRRCFEKIALNLLSNAIKFTPPGGTIEATATMLADDAFEFAVQDSGVGIAADKLPLLFQRFSQVDSSATRAYGGTGIGLALVKELAELMGGSVGVDSMPGLGARFSVRLPLGAQQGAFAGAAAAPRSADETALCRLHLDGGAVPAGAAERVPPAGAPRQTVLVVDDNAGMRDYLAELLAPEWDIASAADGEAAWTLLQRHPVDVVVSDVMMPRLDGLGLTARIKGDPGLSRLPVILLTARGGSAASAGGLAAGADDYIAKPFSPLELTARVRAVLRMAGVQAELREKSRQAGMAEIATNVLHNVGNILNSVNVSADLISLKLRASKVQGLSRAAQMLDEHRADLGAFLSQDEKGRLLPDYMEKLALALAAEHQDVIGELEHLNASIGHIKDVVATQQSYAGRFDVVEPVQMRDLIEDALRMNGGALTRHQVQVVRRFADVPAARLDKTRVMQILVNLISNAKHAMAAPGERVHVMTLTLEVAPGAGLRVSVADEGEGIAADNLARIFTHGFTTRKEGHGFGLHSCALAATEMGGTLSAHSEGRGKGARFTLELPLERPAGESMPPPAQPAAPRENAAGRWVRRPAPSDVSERTTMKCDRPSGLST